MQDILIVGAGTAGLTAAIYAARAGKTVTVLENEAVGGQIATSPQVENYPGFESISGADVSDRLFTQATALGVSVELEKAQAVRAQDGMFTVETSGESYSARALILATGVKHRRLGLAEEASYLGRGLSYCAVCDGAFFKNRTVAVVGRRQRRTAKRDLSFRRRRKGVSDPPPHAVPRGGGRDPCHGSKAEHRTRFE